MSALLMDGVPCQGVLQADSDSMIYARPVATRNECIHCVEITVARCIDESQIQSTQK